MKRVMRIRYKPWARQELEESSFYIDKPEECKGIWRNKFENKNNPIYLELGCGKGGFISKIASRNSNINFIAIDIVDAMLGLAKRNVESEYASVQAPINNLYLTRFDIQRISLIFSEEDKIDRIYINFCNPWPRGKHRKKRLTHTRQLEEYKKFLTQGGEIFFKTDDDNLFNDSLIYFERAGYTVIKSTYNLEQEVDFWDNIETEHEKMFKEQGINIKAAIAVKE